MKVMTLLGTRPEIIRLSRIIEKLDRECEHAVVHTGQNYDPKLSDVFFDELGVRAPDRHLSIRASTFGGQIGKILAAVEETLRELQPDRLLVLGDTNSALGVIVAKRMGVPVFHMEAGNRCYDDRVPEEVNRRLIDHASDVLMPYTERSRQNLLREGFANDRVLVVGNPIYEVISFHEDRIRRSDVLKQLGLEAQGYILVTMHREENVDDEARLRSLVSALELLGREYARPVLCSTHPRTRKRMESFGVTGAGPSLTFAEPFGFGDFIALERDAFCVLSDSGTVQEECCIHRVPNVTIRDVTERLETIECGSSMLSGAEPESVLACVRAVTRSQPAWTPPPEYVREEVSTTVVKIVLGYHQRRVLS